jgi:transcriptional regulator with XRE-family HTH domain
MFFFVYLQLKTTFLKLNATFMATMTTYIPHPSSINMLPHPYSPDFPAALKARRELRGMSRAALARAANIHGVMPRRYEEPDCGEFAHPRPETTWLALNRALGYEIPEDLERDFSKVLCMLESGMFESGPIADPDEAKWAPNTMPVDDAIAASPVVSGLLLGDATLEDIIKFLHSKNIEPTFRHLLVK